MNQTYAERRKERNPFRDSATVPQLIGASLGIRGDLDGMASQIVKARDRAYMAIERRGDQPIISYLERAINDEKDIAFGELRDLLGNRDHFALATSILPQELLVAYLSKNPQLLGSNGRFSISLEDREDGKKFVCVYPLE